MPIAKIVSWMQITEVWEMVFKPLELTTEETEAQKYHHVSKNLRCCGLQDIS